MVQCGGRQNLVDALALLAEMHVDPSTIPPVCADPDDDYLFALAQSAGARVIISGDRKVQAVDVVGIEVMSPALLSPNWTTSVSWCSLATDLAVIPTPRSRYWRAWSPDLLGCVAAAPTYDECVALMREAIADHLEVMREHGDPIPVPSAINAFTIVAA